jgi:hypothetical protein
MEQFDVNEELSSLWPQLSLEDKRKLVQLIRQCVKQRETPEGAIRYLKSKLPLWKFKSDSRPASSSSESTPSFPEEWLDLDDSDALRTRWTGLTLAQRTRLLDLVKSSGMEEVTLAHLESFIGLVTETKKPALRRPRVETTSESSSSEGEEVEAQVQEVMNIRLEKPSLAISLLVRVNSGGLVWVEGDRLLSKEILDSLREVLVRLR